MLDLNRLDALFDETGSVPPLMLAHFDERVRFPLRDLHMWLERHTGEAIEPSRIHELAERGWFPVMAGNVEDDDLGAPLYVPERLDLLLRLEREGWTQEELRAFAEYEDSMIADVFTTDELAYDRSDYELLEEDLRDTRAMLKNTLRVLDEPGWTPTNGGWHPKAERNDTVRKIGKTYTVLEHVRQFEGAEILPADLAKIAFRIRFTHEFTRIMLCQMDRERTKAGYSFFVHFHGAQNPSIGDFGDGIDWKATLCRPWSAEDGLPIRLPGLVLRGQKADLIGSPHPSKYQELWREYELERYFTLHAEIGDLKVCVHCLGALPDTAHPKRKYCGERCRNAAKGRRHRERDPEGVLDSQIRYYSALGDLRTKNSRKKE